MRRYEVVGDGCATGSSKCPHTDPVTVYELDRNGRRRFNLTSCADRSEVGKL